jgi:hypothetical protein
MLQMTGTVQQSACLLLMRYILVSNVNGKLIGDADSLFAMISTVVGSVTRRTPSTHCSNFTEVPRQKL